jgi:hypothetical protein
MVFGIFRLSTTILAFTLLGGFVCLSRRPSVSAATIGPTCGSCYGTTDTVAENGLSSTKTTSTYQVPYVDSAAGYVQQVAVRILVSTPDGPDLTMQSGAMSGIGCSGASASFICASRGTSASTWIFDMKNKRGISSPESIKANYDTAKDTNSPEENPARENRGYVSYLWQLLMRSRQNGQRR